MFLAIMCMEMWYFCCSGPGQHRGQDCNLGLVTVFQVKPASNSGSENKTKIKGRERTICADMSSLRNE